MENRYSNLEAKTLLSRRRPLKPIDELQKMHQKMQGYDGIHRDIISPSTNIRCIDLIHQPFYGDVLWCMMEV